MQDEDKQIEIKKRARRRLVGAAALALFAVIVLPMVMDSELRPQEQDIQIKIPAQSGDNSVARAIEDVAEPAPVALPEPALAPASAPASDAGGAPSAAAPTASAKAAAEQKPASGSKAAGAPARAPVIDEGMRAAAILAGRSPDTLAATPEQFVVQLGAYRDRGNALSLQNKLKSDGFSSYTERAGDKTRVRIGPFADRAGAEAALARVKQLGLSGSVMPRD